MKKTLYLAAAITVLACNAALAEGLSNNYNFVEAGYQKSNYSSTLYYGSFSAKSDIDADGFYLRGSFNFYDNAFVEARKDRTSYSYSNAILNGELTLDQDLYALGYFFTINPAWSVYGTVGYSVLDISAEASNVAANTKLSYQMSGASVEVGTRIDAFDFWHIEPAFRVASYDESMYEIRLNNAFSITENVALDINAMHRAHEINNTVITEVSGQVGIRYSF
ncbi:hypothetical protein B6A42_06160 [Vibrio coralliilyticus]|uniref:hypothetical protein n=1 Tax=Vibrio TaxID=662 RepID=UPI00031D1BAB|nr:MULTISPECIES: hypothetical protein [Vibrio]ARC91770.1 hypothetical protein B6A42_06160 [Vibrio coralliilyticus]NOH61845.1 porin family protein [Vibrio sp. RE88]